MSAYKVAVLGDRESVMGFRALVRMLKSGVEPELLGQVLTDCGTVSLKELSAAYPDVASTLALYRSTGLASLLSSDIAAAISRRALSFR